jgi:transcriptional regulator with XRE-family HTH domain
VALFPKRSFGRRVRELRRACDLTQEDLAERCGLFRTYMSRIETGQANPTLTMIHTLAASLGVSVVALFGSSAAPAPAKRPAVRPARGRVSR